MMTPSSILQNSSASIRWDRSTFPLSREVAGLMYTGTPRRSRPPRLPADPSPLPDHLRSEPPRSSPGDPSGTPASPTDEFLLGVESDWVKEPDAARSM